MQQQFLIPNYMKNERWPLDVLVYSDEIKPFTNSLGERWMYLGLVIIPGPRYDEARLVLENLRRDVGYNGELHFTTLRNYSYAHQHNKKTLLARRWVEAVLYDSQKTFHYYLLGINLSNIQEQAFGDRGLEQKLNMYSRLYRSSILYSLKSFFPGRQVRVAIYHDKENSLQQHPRFDRYNIRLINSQEDNISFLKPSVEFVDSDHQKETRFPQASHFIQLCDILTGGISHVFDARNDKDGCNEIARILVPLVERLIDSHERRNPNSHFFHYQRLSLSFFPSKRLKPKELNNPIKRLTSGFYYHRPLLFVERQSGQMRLPFDK